MIVRTLSAAMLGLLGLVSGPVLAGPREDKLADAVRGDDRAAVRTLLAAHANPNSPLPDKSTVLLWAVDRQDGEIVRLLLAAGAKPNAADQDGATSLILACEAGNAAIVKRLLDAHANAKAVRPDGIGALWVCAGTATPDVLERLIAAGAGADAADPKGQTPLMWAAANGKTDNFAVLIKHGANVNRASKAGLTPLFFALKSHVPGAPQAILDAGGNAGYAAPDGTTAVQVAVFQNNIPFAAMLVTRGADVKGWDRNGDQLLHVAVANKDLGFARLLLTKGADANAVSRPKPFFDPEATDGKAHPAAAGALKKKLAPMTPLLLAARAGSQEMMQMLVSAGARADFKAEDGTNVVLAAAGGGNLEALKYALQLNPDINALTDSDQGVLHIALGNPLAPDAEAMVQFLADRGATLDGKDKRGKTPEAVSVEDPERIKDLYLNILNAHGLTPTHPLP